MGACCMHWPLPLVTLGRCLLLPRYPFQISKSNLTAVGSPHTWPSLLAALTWLVELLNYQERAEASRQVRVAYGGQAGLRPRRRQHGGGRWAAACSHMSGCRPWLLPFY